MPGIKIASLQDSPQIRAALYERLGYILAGIILDYALLPHGGLTGTMIYWKRIGAEG
jgi:hypothetical protein